MTLVVNRPYLPVETEVPLQDLLGFLADVGGYVGILLGVSCWSLYDVIAGLAKKRL